VVSPDRAGFRELAHGHAVVPVWRELLADLTTPVSLFARCVGDGEGFLLESVDRAETWGRWSFIGRHPSATLTSIGGELLVDGDLPDGIRTGEGMLAALEDLLAHFKSPSIEGMPPLHGGLMGYLGYDVVREVEDLPDTPPDDKGFPDGMMSIIGELVAIDHWRQRAILIVNVVVPTEPSSRECPHVDFRSWFPPDRSRDRSRARSRVYARGCRGTWDMPPCVSRPV